MQTEKVHIVLDSETNTYLTGTKIHGSIKIVCADKGKKIRGVSFRIVGRGKCAWTGLQQQRSPAEQTLPDNGTTAATTNCNGASTSLPAAAAGAAVSAQSNTTAAVDNTDAAAAAATATTAADPPAISAATSADGAAKSDLALHYSGEEVYVDETVFLVGSKNAPSYTVHPSNCTFEFAYALPAHLPSTFKGQYGKIKYYIEFTVYLPWRFDETYRVPLHIRHAVDLNADAGALRPYQRQLTRVVGLISHGPVTLYMFVPRTGCATGDRLPVQVLVTNRSKTHIDKVKFTLVQNIVYHSTSPARYMRTESVRVVRKEAGGVDRNSEQRYEHMLEIPDTLLATRTGAGIINISYELQIEAKVAGLYKNLQLTVPFVVATLPFFSDAVAVPGDGASTQQPEQSTPPVAPPIGFHHWQQQHGSSAGIVINNHHYYSDTSSRNATPTPSAYPSMQSLPNVLPYRLDTPPYTPPSSSSIQHPPPNYAHATSMSASIASMPPYNPYFQPQQHHRQSLRSERRISPTAPPLDFVTPPDSVGSTRSSISSSVQRPALWETLPPSYADVYGAAAATTVPPASSSSSSSTISLAAPSRSESPAALAQGRRKQRAPPLPA